MSSLKSFYIVLDRDSFMPGDLITGKVIMELTKTKKIKALTVSVNGEACVEWEALERIRVTGKKNKKVVKVRFHTTEIYIRAQCCLLGSTTDHAEVQLAAGFGIYTFSFQLPYDIPCNFEHKYGYIRYSIKAIIHRPSRYNHQSKIPFTITTPYDLNLYSHQCLGINEEIYKGIGCCNNGIIKVCIMSQTTGFVPGQSIKTMVDYVNKSNAKVRKICYKLEQILEFKARTPFHAVEKVYTVLKKEQYRNVMDKEGTIISDLEIPSTVPSELQFCNIINQRYKLRITIHMSGCNSKIVESYPIVIGTIPLNSMIPSEPRVSSCSQTVLQPTAPLLHNIENPAVTMPMPMPTDANSSDQPGPSWNIPPPSYNDCIHRTTVYTVTEQTASKITTVQ